MSGKTVELTDDGFDAAIAQAGVPVLVDFWAPWCGPCKMVAPHLEALAEEKGATLVVAKVNVDESAKIASKFGIRSIPTLMLFKDGEPLATKVGALNKGQLEAWISSQL